MGGVGTEVYICETMEELGDQRKLVFVMELAWKYCRLGEGALAPCTPANTHLN
jgi:hypothetical protein